jgi:hypothetical protein
MFHPNLFFRNQNIRLKSCKTSPSQISKFWCFAQLLGGLMWACLCGLGLFLKIGIVEEAYSASKYTGRSWGHVASSSFEISNEIFKIWWLAITGFHTTCYKPSVRSFPGCSCLVIWDLFAATEKPGLDGWFEASTYLWAPVKEIWFMCSA